MQLLPHDTKFFDIFDHQIDLVRRTAGLLTGVPRNGTTAADAARQASELQRQGDRVLEEVYDRLNKSFITPLDPEDLHRLASSLDQILDEIEAVLYRLDAFGIRPEDDAIGPICDLIADGSGRICDAFGGLKHSKFKERQEQITAASREIEQIHLKARDAVRLATRQLLDTERDTVRLIKMKDVYDRLGVVAESLKRTALILRNVIIKNS